MSKKLRVKFMVVLLSLGLLAIFMGGCYIPDDLEAFIEGLIGPRIIQPSPEVLVPSPDGLFPSEGVLVPTQNGMLPLPDGFFPFPLI